VETCSVSSPQEPIFPAQKNQIRTLPFRAGARLLDGFQELDQVVLLLVVQPQFENVIVVVDDVGQGRESAVMVEATFMDLLRIEKRAQRFCAVTIIG
jgi:hypothetical protein